MSILLRRTRRAGWLLLAAGLLLQFGLKDRLPGLALLFYALPQPCLLALAAALALAPGATLRSRLGAVAVALPLALAWLAPLWTRPPADAAALKAEDLRLLVWNVARPTGPHAGLIDLIRVRQPHVVAVIEPGRVEPDWLRAYETALPGYRADWMPRGLLWLSRMPSRYRERGKLEGIGAYARFEVGGLGPTFPVVVADVFAHVLKSRHGQLQEVLAQARDRSDALLVGDFNTPLESVFFQPWRTRYQNVFEMAGSGLAETWPLGLPLLSLDQVWVGSDWQVIGVEKLWRVRDSDHAALWVELRKIGEER
jgi:endonuclease/exonuclease/phosphatase (EEP) superfamily protein YafD